MNYVDTVLESYPNRKHVLPTGPGQLARVHVLVDDPFGVFVGLVLRGRPRHIVLVSPWLSSDGLTGRRLERLVKHVSRHRSMLTLLTKRDSAAAHLGAIEAVELAGGTVVLNSRLHAKLYLCEQARGRGLAVIGSANMTNRSLGLSELAVLVRASGRSRVIQDLKAAALCRLSPRRPAVARRHHGSLREKEE